MTPHYNHTPTIERMFALMDTQPEPNPRPEPIRPQPDPHAPASWWTIYGAMIANPHWDNQEGAA